MQTTARSLQDACLTDAHFPQLPGFYRGKVRDAYDLPDGRRVMIATDRQSAFDKVLAAVPYKGQVLNQMARFWFDQTSDVCPNHVLSYPDPNIVIARTLSMLPVEMVVRDYMTGSTDTSIWTMYNRGAREMYGIRFQDGLTKNEKLPNTILTPTTKAAQGEHDAPITPTDIAARGLLTQKQWDELARISLALFARGREIAAKHGLILVDTKYEFGVDEKGRITLADEVHTPDSSRYWMAASYAERRARKAEPESLDKEFLRLWINARCDPYKDPIPEVPAETLLEFSGKYIKLYELITGEKFQRPAIDKPVHERVAAALNKALPEFFRG